MARRAQDTPQPTRGRRPPEGGLRACCSTSSTSGRCSRRGSAGQGRDGPRGCPRCPAADRSAVRCGSRQPARLRAASRPAGASLRSVEERMTVRSYRTKVDGRPRKRLSVVMCVCFLVVYNRASLAGGPVLGPPPGGPHIRYLHYYGRPLSSTVTSSYVTFQKRIGKWAMYSPWILHDFILRHVVRPGSATGGPAYDGDNCPRVDEGCEGVLQLAACRLR